MEVPEYLEGGEENADSRIGEDLHRELLTEFLEAVACTLRLNICITSINSLGEEYIFVIIDPFDLGSSKGGIYHPLNHWNSLRYAMAKSINQSRFLP